MNHIKKTLQHIRSLKTLRMTSKSPTDLETLRQNWTTLYQRTLPQLAKSRSSAQPHWPVTLDHCFARIILDNTIGKAAGPNGTNVQWDKVIAKPAVKNMSVTQLEAAIALGEKIKDGAVNLEELDRRSLEFRGKEGKGKRKREEDTDEKSSQKETQSPSKKKLSSQQSKAKPDTTSTGNASGKKQSRISFQSSSEPKQEPSPPPSDTNKDENEDESSSAKDNKARVRGGTQNPKKPPYPSSDFMLSTLSRIQNHNGLTPFRKRLYTALLSVPCGEHTTYAAMARHLGSVPRAVGNGMRNNPFAPDVPCHRVLASDGSLGGFFGDWGVEGKYANDKMKLLDEEGVRFSSTGKVKGPVWEGFLDEREIRREFGAQNGVKV